MFSQRDSPTLARDAGKQEDFSNRRNNTLSHDAGGVKASIAGSPLRDCPRQFRANLVLRLARTLQDAKAVIRRLRDMERRPVAQRVDNRADSIIDKRLCDELSERQ